MIGVRKLLTPREYLDLSETEKEAISSVRFIYPEMKKRDFGRFEITFRYLPYERARKFSAAKAKSA